jgi:hypothetical protein
MQVSLHDVREALEELGRLRFGEMNVDDAIREIVHTTHSMFSVDGAGLMLCDADQQLRSVAASDGRFEQLEELQIRHGEGPCIEAYESKKLVGAEDLTGSLRPGPRPDRPPVQGPAAADGAGKVAAERSGGPLP